MPTQQELKDRAYAAWLTHAPRRRGHPTPSATTVEVYDERVYVVLRRGDQVVDIYLYKPATPGFRDTLVYLRRNWPGPYGRARATVAA